LDLSPAKVKQALARKADTATQPAVQQQAPASTPNVPTPTAASPKPTKVLNDNEDPPLPSKAIQHSITQIFKARDVIESRDINKKKFESALATIRTHASKLDIAVPGVRTYFYADEYRDAATAVTIEIVKRYGSFPTQERRDRRDAARASMAQPARQGLPEQAATPASPAPIEIRDRGTKAPAAVEQPRNAAVDVPPTDTQIGPMTLDQFLNEGHEIYKVTRDEWIAMNVAKRQAEGLPVESKPGITDDAMSDYEKVHADAVTKHVASGGEISYRVSQDYPDARPNETPARAAQIDRIVAMINEYEKQKQDTWVQATETKGSDGKWYRLDMPAGVRPTDERRVIGYVRRAKDGVTYGEVYPTLEAAKQADARLTDATLQQTRESLASLDNKRLESDEEFWLSESGRSKRTGGDTADAPLEGYNEVYVVGYSASTLDDGTPVNTYRLSKNGYTISKHSDGRFSLTGGATVMGHFDSLRDAMEMAQRAPDIGVWATQREQVEFDDGTTAVTHTLSNSMEVMEADGKYELRRRVGPGIQSLGTFDTLKEATDAAGGPPELRPTDTASKPYTLKEWDGEVDGIVNLEGTVAERLVKFERLLGSLQSLQTELNKLTIKQLSPMVGPMVRSGTSKAEMVEKAINRMLLAFNIRSGIQYDPFKEKYQAAVIRTVRNTTEQELQEHREAVQAARRKREEAIANPQTLADFNTLMLAKGSKALTPEQRRTYEALVAEADRKLDNARQTTRIEQVDTGDVTLSYKEGFHDKDKYTLHIVQLTGGRVPHETFANLKNAAKRLGGWWSSFRKDQSGFQFKTKEAADEFIKVNQQAITTKAADEARETDAQERASERLSEQAERMTESAEESLGQDRLSNTARRARMAAAAEQDARRDLAMAKTLENVAFAIREGIAPSLSGVRNAAQIRELNRVLMLAKRDYYESLDDAGRDRVRRDYNGDWTELPVTDEIIDKAKLRMPELHRSELQDLVTYGNQTPGLKRDAARVAKLLAARKGQESDRLVVSSDADILTLRNLATAAKRASGRFKYAGEYIHERVMQHQRLVEMGLKSDAALRTALREYKALRARPPEADKVREMERALVGRQVGKDFFPTPVDLAERMVSNASIEPGMRVLEPSAGNGRIADAIRAAGVEPHVVEMSPSLREILAAKNYTMVGNDFEEFTPSEKYDRIVMNPPFGTGTEGTDGLHVRRAYDMLAPGGRLVAVMSSGTFARSDAKAKAFRDWLESVGGTNEPLPTDTFSRDRTGMPTTDVNTQLVVIDKPGSPDDVSEAVAEPTQNDEATAEAAEYQRQQAEYNASAAEAQRLQQLGTSVVPGIRLQEAESAGRAWEAYQANEVTKSQWEDYVDDLYQSGKANGPTLASVKRGDIVFQKPDADHPLPRAGVVLEDSSDEWVKIADVTARMATRMAPLASLYKRANRHDPYAAQDFARDLLAGTLHASQPTAPTVAEATAPAPVADAVPAEQSAIPAQPTVVASADDPEVTRQTIVKALKGYSMSTEDREVLAKHIDLMNADIAEQSTMDGKVVAAIAMLEVATQAKSKTLNYQSEGHFVNPLASVLEALHPNVAAEALSMLELAGIKRHIQGALQGGTVQNKASNPTPANPEEEKRLLDERQREWASTIVPMKTLRSTFARAFGSEQLGTSNDSPLIGSPHVLMLKTALDAQSLQKMQTLERLHTTVADDVLANAWGQLANNGKKDAKILGVIPAPHENRVYAVLDHGDDLAYAEANIVQVVSSMTGATSFAIGRMGPRPVLLFRKDGAIVAVQSLFPTESLGLANTEYVRKAAKGELGSVAARTNVVAANEPVASVHPRDMVVEMTAVPSAAMSAEARKAQESEAKAATKRLRDLFASTETRMKYREDQLRFMPDVAVAIREAKANVKASTQPKRQKLEAEAEREVMRNVLRGDVEYQQLSATLDRLHAQEKKAFRQQIDIENDSKLASSAERSKNELATVPAIARYMRQLGTTKWWEAKKAADEFERMTDGAFAAKFPTAGQSRNWHIAALRKHADAPPKWAATFDPDKPGKGEVLPAGWKPGVPALSEITTNQAEEPPSIVMGIDRNALLDRAVKAGRAKLVLRAETNDERIRELVKGLEDNTWVRIGNTLRYGLPGDLGMFTRFAKLVREFGDDPHLVFSNGMWQWTSGSQTFRFGSLPGGSEGDRMYVDADALAQVKNGIVYVSSEPGLDPRGEFEAARRKEIDKKEKALVKKWKKQRPDYPSLSIADLQSLSRARGLSVDGGRRGMIERLHIDDDIVDLESALQRSFGPHIVVMRAEPVGDLEQELSSLLRRSGITPVFVSIDGDNGAVEGVYLGRGDTRVYLRSGMGEEVGRVALHEALHVLRTQKPKLYSDLVRAVGEQTIAKFATLYGRRLASTFGDDHPVVQQFDESADMQQDEGLADAVGSMAADPAVRDAIRRKPGLWTRIKAWVAAFLERMGMGNQGAGLRKAVLDLLRRMDEDEAPDPNAPRPDDLADQFALSKSKLIDDPEIQRKQAEADAALSKDMEEDRREYFGTKEGMWRMLSQMYATRNRLTQVVQEVRRHITHDGGVVEKNQFRYIISRNTYPGGKPWRVSQFVYRNGKWLPWGHVETAVLDDPATATDLYPRGAVQEVAKNIGTKHKGPLVSPSFSPSGKPVPSRKEVVAEAKALGLPGIGTTESIANRVRIIKADPSTWTRADFDAVKDSLAIHQDVRPGSDERVASIMRDGLRSGMVDSVGAMDRKAWTWAKQLMGGDVYVFASGTLEYIGDSAYLKPGNKPLFHYKAEKGQDLYEAMTGRRKGDSRNPQVDTPQFKSWFKDSKVVDGAGNPLIVKHGSPDVRGIFAEGFKARSRGNVWFAAADTDVADSYANERRAMDYQNAEPQTIPLYLSIQNPMVVDAQGKHWRDTERHVQEAKDAGHDGIIIKNSVDYYENKGRKAARPTTVYAWFAPSQAKSAVQGQLRSRIDGKPIEGATGNVGTFDPANPDIRFSVSGKVYRDTLGFERKAERLIQEKVKGAMQAADLRKMLLNNGVTADEMKWSGWDDALATDRKLTLPEILAIAAQSRVELSEVVKGGSNDDKRMAEATQRADAAQQTLKAAFNELVKEGTSDINETFVGKFKEVAWSSLRLLKALNGDDAARQIESTDRLAAFLRSESASFVSPYGPNGKTLRNRLVDALAKPRLVEAAREYITASQEQRRIRDETDESWMRNRTQFERYTLPGGTDYREVLLTLPKKAKSYQDFKAAGMSDAEAQRAANATFEQDYQSSHFPEPNIIAHMRLKDRTTPDGRRVLHIEEIQSDWHQAGRDRGYADPAVFAKLRAELEAADKEVADRFANKEAYAKSNPGMKPGEDDGTWDRLVEAHRRAIINRDRIKQDLRKPEQVPAAPFSKNWHEMAFRRVLRMAAEGGYDALAWTTGEQQAARFDLSKEVDAVHWQPSTSELWVDKRSGRETKQRKVADNVTAANLEQYVGRETARRILAAQEVDTYKSAYGDDLKVGGEGMREFYDRQLVRYADKYGKKWGAKVQDGQVLTKDRVPDPLMQQFTDDGVSYMTVRGTAIANPLADIQHGEPLEESEAVDYWVNLGVERAVAEDAITRFKRDQAEAERRVAERGEYEVDAHVLPITDAMRESVMGEGQVLFSIAGTPAQWADQAAAKAKVPAAEASMPVIADVEAARLVVADMVKSGTLKPTEAKAAAEKVLKGVDGARVQPASVLARRVAARLEKVANPTGNDVEQAFREVAFAHVTNAADVALRGARRAEADASVGTSRESRIREMERLQGLERSYRKAADEYKPESAKGKEESPDATRDRLLRRPAAPDRPVNVPAAAAVMKQSLLAAGLEVAVKAVAKKAAGKKVGRKSIYQFVDEAIGTRPVLRQQRDAVNRVARGFLRDVGALGKPNPADPAPGTPEYKTVMGERVEEAYRQAVSDLQTSAAARRQQADARAGAIREGMSPAEGMVSASDAAKASYRAQERLGRKMASTAARTVVAAMRQARQAARAEATAKVASLQRRWQRRFDRLKDKVWTARTDLTVEQQRTRARRRLEREIRRELTDVIRKYMPRTLRGDYITMVRDATNPGRLNDALVAIQHDLTFHNAKEATRMGLQTAKGKWVERIRGDKAAKAAYDAAVQTLMDAARRLKETNKVAKQPQPAKLTTMAGGTGSVGTATKRMSVDDLLALQDRVEQAHAELLFLRKDAAEKEQIRVEGKVLARETVVESVLKSLALRPDLARPLGLPAATRTSLLGRYHIANATPDTIAAMLRNPLARKLLVEELWRGETDAMADTYAATDEMKRLLAAAGFEWGSEKLHRLSYTSAGPDAQQMTLNLPDAGQVTASPGEWMAVLATLARESSGRKILEEGRPITFGRDTHMTPVTLTAADADAISDALDKMGLVSVVHGGMKFMSGTADALNKAYYSATGRYLKLEPLYFPTHVNRDQQPIENLIGAGPQYVRRALENLGFLQPTDERATSPYLIKDFFDEYNQYTHASAIMVHMTDRVRAMEAVFKDRRILAEIERKFGSDINERLDRMIEAGKLLFSEPKSRLDKVAVSLGRKIAKAELTLNPGTWMKQFGSVPKLYAVMDAEHIAAGIENMMDPVVTDLLKNDAYFRNRIEDAVYRRMSPSDYKRSPSLGQVNTADAIKRIMEGGVFVTERSRAAWGSATDRIEVMNWFDGISSRVAIGAALSMGRAKGLTGQALLRYAAWEAQMAIRRVNNTSSVLDMSGWAERNRGNWLSLSMLFTSDANKNYNLIAAAFEDQGGKVAGKKMGRAIVGIAASNLWGAMIGALIGTLTKYGLSALFDDDEAREALMGEVGSQFVRSNLGSLYFGDVIYDLTRAGYRVATKQPVQVNSVFETPVSSKVADATEGAIRFAKSFEAQGRYTSGRNRGEYRDEVMYREGLWQMAEAISGLMGNPLLPWMRYLRKYMQQE
jgi:predicted RNA methylase